MIETHRLSRRSDPCNGWPRLPAICLLLGWTACGSTARAQEAAPAATAPQPVEALRNPTAEKLEALAAGGNITAQLKLAAFCASGRNGMKDEHRAVTLLQPLAMRGIPKAQFLLGLVLEQGAPEIRKPAEAAQWFAKASAQGDTPSEVNLGVCYAKGEGVAADPAEAAKWWMIAKNGGSREAARNLTATVGQLPPGSAEKIDAEAKAFVPKLSFRSRLGAPSWFQKRVATASFFANYNPHLVEQPWNTLANKVVTPMGEAALAIDPTRWKHTQTDNFIIHYRNPADANRVVKQIEFVMLYVTGILQCRSDEYERKSHVFLFGDLNEWRAFTSKVGVARWAAGFAYGDELFLPMDERIDTSTTLAHECTHAVVARVYPGIDWPLWLNEGFAECCAAEAVTARHMKIGKPYLPTTSLPLSEFTTFKTYTGHTDMNQPPGPALGETATVGQFYACSKAAVQLVLNRIKPEQLPDFIDYACAGNNIAVALRKTTGNQALSMEALDADFARDFRKLLE